MTEIIQKMLAALRTRTGRDTQLVLLGQVLSATFGFALNVLILRKLSIDDYGTFTLFVSAMMLLGGFMHLGWIETFVRFGAIHREEPLYRSLRRLMLRRTVVSALAIGAIAWAASRWISTSIYHRAGFVTDLRMAIVAALFLVLFSFSQNDSRARGAFKAFFVTQVGSNATRFCLAMAVLAAGLMSVRALIGVYTVTPILFAVGYALFLATSRRSAELPPVGAEVRSKILSYNSWLLLSMFTTNIIGNIDSHILAHYHGNMTLSAFGAAARLTLPIQFLISSMTTTLLPRLSAAKSDDEIRFYLSRLKLFLIPLAALTLLACFIGPPILIWIAGPQYHDIGFLIRLQILTMLVVLVTNPAGVVLYAWGATRGIALLNIVQLVVDLSLDLLWIPSHGAAGAIAATLVVNLIGFAYIYSAVYLRLFRTPAKENA